MIIWEPFNFLFENDQPILVPMEVLHKVSAGTPDAVRVCIDRCEESEQVLADSLERA